MGKHRLRRWLAVAAALSLGLAPVIFIQLEGGVAGATTTSDTVNYVQSSSASSYSFVPGSGSPSTTQSITPTGTCKTPSTSGAPLLSLSALVYKNLVSGKPYTGPPSTGTVGTSLGHTGGCDLSPAYAINQNEALIFAPGSNPLTSTRTFSEAKVPLALTSSIDSRNDTAPLSGDYETQSATVWLFALNGTTVVATTSLTITGDGDGDPDDTMTADTGVIPGGFTSLKLEVTAPSSSKYGVSVVGTTSFSLSQIPQAITFTNPLPASPTVGGSYTVSATGGGSGIPVLFSVDASATSVCSLNTTSDLVSLNAAGLCVIDANQAGNATYAPAPTAKQSVNVSLIPQVITFSNTPPSTLVVGGTYTVIATASSNLPVTFSVDGTSSAGCKVDPNSGVVNLTGPAGTCVIDANQAGNASYAAAPTAMQSAGVGLAPQTITFTSTPPQVALVGNTYQVTATGGSSGNPVVITIDPSSTSECAMDATVPDQVDFNSTQGTCVIDANQAGNASYAPAPQQQQDLNVYAQEVCGQQVISTQSTDGTVQSGQVSASLTFKDYQGEPAPTGVCKGYTALDASADNQTVTFSSQSLATAHMTATITWAYDSFCTPDGSGGTTECPPTYVSFDGGATFVPQTYCTSAQAAGIEWCTTSRQYTFTPNGTQITETWDGYGDPIWHHG
ncbi:MAG TPA: hypothetical protein VGZ33_00650 [Acidimicrobiales bacterium]|nr:hypothetical protein [Acidimicrobiales bacterium]